MKQATYKEQIMGGEHSTDIIDFKNFTAERNASYMNKLSSIVRNIRARFDTSDLAILILLGGTYAAMTNINDKMDTEPVISESATIQYQNSQEQEAKAEYLAMAQSGQIPTE